ncbi:hypothetical protein Shewmr4_2740 [Shewanella sp. MR-4]|uniref:hypothetical protein n=1 Tax=Shewanella sp. (strain MR-4) TaxID=60480 RepID=UPI00005E5B8F|nr:hypothetical protein [Shewanella sp. MR-4]ABI39811.1 hypothetical protein Shewmr4_2740 [Shewanella sp. MR-4]
MNEFAPEYTKKEKMILMLKHAAWAIPLLVITKYWFFPWFEVYTENAHCYRYGNITGTEVVFYGLFVGLPLLSAILVFLVEGPNCIKILRYGQSPLPGEKVFKPTKYVYGFRAKLKPLLLFIALACFIGLSVKGIYSANQTINMVNPKELPTCKSS